MAWQARKFYEETGQTVDLGNPNASLLNAANDIIDDGAVEIEAIITAATGRTGAKCVVMVRRDPEFTAKFAVKGDSTDITSIRGYLTGIILEAQELEDAFFYRLAAEPQIRTYKLSTLTGQEASLPGNSQTILAGINKILSDMASEMWSLLQQYGPANPTASEFVCFVRSEQGKDIIYSIVEV